jgi:hypothetical protein
MKKVVPPAFWKKIIPVALVLTALLLAWAADRHSLQRANRLYRAGAFQEAATIYADRLGRGSASAQLRYNFGTALLSLRNGKASEELASASREGDDGIRVRALYNLGLWHLIEALLAAGSDSARAHALSAVAANKSVLRLRPGHAEAGWNLGICLRLLASIDAETLQAGPAAAKGTAPREGAPSEQDVNRKEDGQDAPRAAEGETAARSAENARLSQREVAQILGTGHRDPAMMVRKLIASEGRALRLRASGRSAEGER